MSRPRKFIPGPPIRSLNDLWARIARGEYILVAQPGRGKGRFQSVNPGWIASWQLRMTANAIERGSLRRALPNPDHPDNRKDAPK